ncbi:glycosyltransferase family protein [Acetobacter thailandicus]|uniref:hypothetical protein n=1 Tax=Acetobacter thailandicus TaxID=1502842 RepID=UPI001BAA8CED|nr:hypothetical protein [Acetobacter thailandicus]MBS0960590.1 hypothetical protein [Acetobacter thailandicus]
MHILRPSGARPGFYSALTLCLFMAFTARLLVAIVWPQPWRPDEIFQYMEPAHKLAFGTGITTWEWHAGIRSWLVPGIIAQLMKIGAACGITQQLLFIRVCTAFFSLPVVIAFFWYGWRNGGSAMAWTLGVSAAFWPDILSGGIRTLGEFLAGNVLCVGVICLVAYRQESTTRTYFFLAAVSGFCLSLAAAIRFQIAPASALAFLFLLQKGKIKPFFIGCLAALIPVTALGLTDYLTLEQAFQSVFRNYHYNQTLGVANSFGKKWPGYYVQKYALLWGALFPALIFFCIKSGKERRIPLLVAIFIVFYHSLIPHKEVSFVYSAVPLLVFCAACGCYTHIIARLSPAAMPVAGLSLLLLFAFYSSYTPYLSRGNYGISFELQATHRHDICGIGLLTDPQADTYREIGAGYSGLTKHIPLYLLTSPEEVKTTQQHYNYLITSTYGESGSPGADWQQIKCKEDSVCLYHRPSGCDGAPDFEQFSQKLHTLSK